MFGRIYALMWLVLAITMASLYFGGQLSDLVMTVAGFFIATLVFIGMALILPSSVNQRSAY